MMHHRSILVAVLAAASFGIAVPLAAQSGGTSNTAGTSGASSGASAALAAIDSLVARSRFRDASAALDRWERDNAARVIPADRATALMLRARMTSDADSARALYLQLSLGYPSAPEAPVALLRLGQIAHASDDMTRAASYFQRAITDYPDSPVKGEATEWLAKVSSASTASPKVTPPKTAAPATKPTTTPRSSNGAGTPAASTAARPSDGGGIPAASIPPRTETRAADAGGYSVQVGAFREKSTATSVAKKLTQLGFAARVAFVNDSTLARVRIGRFATSRDATEEVRRLRAAGYEAVVVDDARQEK